MFMCFVKWSSVINLDLFCKQVFSYTTYIQEEVNYTEPSPQLVIPGYTHKISSTSSLQNLCNFSQGVTGAEKSYPCSLSRWIQRYQRMVMDIDKFKLTGRILAGFSTLQVDGCTPGAYCAAYRFGPATIETRTK